MKLIPICLVLLMLQSCNSQTKNKEEQKDQKMVDKSIVLQPFDLANLTMNEDINDILSSVKLSRKDTIKNDNLTSIGNEKLVFDSEKLLIFNGVQLANKNNRGINNVIFHYGKIDKEIGPLFNEKNNIIGMYQINLYTKTESENLLKYLNLKFKQPKKYNLMSTNTYLWVNNNICYYYYTFDDTENKTEDDNDACNRILFVYKKSDKEWVGFIGALGLSFGGTNFN
jgi:hypothetical protein